MSQPSAISNRFREWELLLDSLSSQILNTFDACDEYEAITQLYKVNGIREIFGKWLLDLAEESQLDKSKVLSLAWRNKGNEFFKEGRLEDCLKYYNFSVLAAPRGHETFPLALANRAAVLLKMAKYKDSVRDSEMALQNGYPQDHRASKLLLRIQEAQKHLSTAGEGQNFSESILRMLPGPNPALVGASSSLDLKYSSDYGRYVVTNREVAAGEVLFVEKPFAFVALPPPNKVLPTVCEACCQPDITPIPCNSCAGSVYCSEECRAMGWENFHRWECAGTRSLLWPTIGIAHLALRSFLVASREGFVLEGGEEQRGRKGVGSAQEALTSMREVCQLSTTPSGYGGIYNLVTNFDKMHKKDFLQYALTSIMLSTYLSEHTSLLSAGDTEEIKLATCRLLRLLGQLVSSGHAVGDTRMATALYPSASMMNHSCAPNIVSSHYKDLLIVKALVPLRRGQEVLNCYGPHYRRLPGAQRRAELLQQYAFHCRCSACSDPKLDNFVNLFKSYLCPECGGPVCKEAFKCENCGKIPQNKEEIQQIAKKSAQLLGEAYIVGRMAKEKVLKILKIQNLQQKYFFKYNVNLRKTNDLLSHLYALEGSYAKSVQVMKSNLPAAKLQFGDRSIEVANELEKLSDVMLLQIKDSGGNEDVSPQALKELCAAAKQTISEALDIFETFNGPWVSSFKELTDKMCFVEEILKASGGL